jgi:arabinofuranosyltransferase
VGQPDRGECPGRGVWQRRWIADDGLIVLRTVRNLLAGNGPVFNAGERVESNTSTLWTYLVYFGSVIGGPLRLEYVALALALTFSVAGLALVMLGTGRLYAPSLQGRRALMLPAGALVYIAIPPARDFATSGLEGGLVPPGWGRCGGCWCAGRSSGTCVPVAAAGPAPDSPPLAFVAGAQRAGAPELALIGGGAC